MPAHPSDVSSSRRDAVLLAARALSARRWRVAATLTLAMVGVYFGFILLVAFRPDMLAQLVSDGLSVGIVLGALVIVSAWVLTLVYVRWANTHYDPALAALRAQVAASGHTEGRTDA